MSDDKDESETRTDRRIAKGIDLIESKIATKDRRNAIIVADSKGRELKKQRVYNAHINIFYQPGAKLRNVHLDSYIKRHINNRTVRSPVVLIWLGTCELTIKTVSGYALINNLDEHVTQLIKSYETYKQELIAINPRTEIVFLPCPFFDLKTYNKSRQYKSIETTDLDQHELEQAIIKYNLELDNLNQITTPSICEDFTKFGKGRKHKTIQKSIDYRQLVDGCHPRPEITKLWLLKFIKLIDRMI